ncbi:MAG: glycosyltransferase [Leptolyngbyaceae cyanobacterium SL_1_1]|nr:glycosyltransferase [Leptolyngbyaceae cyanobacterium RM1_1_2]NJO08318.1 glycosyltransferase [Leptolyngbyaceae cyanobacterium SL_1_1]
MTIDSDKIGIVVIGRNEGAVLDQTLTSVKVQNCSVIYVDSGSTDNSIEIAKALQVDILCLDDAVPFTAARAYNAGVQYLMDIHPGVEFIQFLDGDCELVVNWLSTAYQAITADPTVAAVCGRRREKQRDRSVYNLLCDIEWDTPVGEVGVCVDALMRTEFLAKTKGFRTDLIAGEEPELCFRLRQIGGRVIRLDADSSVHDAKIYHFSQWWKRSQRGGYAYAEQTWLHRHQSGFYCLKETSGIWIWGFVLPVLSVVLAIAMPTVGFISTVILYLTKIFQIAARTAAGTNLAAKEASIYAFFCLLGKFPELQGQLQFCLNQLLGKRQTLIEYKGPDISLEQH